MKRLISRQGLWVVEVSLFTYWLAAAGAWAGIAQPLYVGNLLPVRDALGQPMKGSPLPQDEASRSFVEIRTAADGIIRAPGTNGMASPYNPLLAANSVGGVGANAKAADSGLFCLLFSNRPPAGTKIFARVYDAPTVDAAAFYVDSAVATVPTNGVSVVLAFGAAQPLDPGDDDADGLNNSWEQVLGTSDRPSADYDEDGMSDLNEMLAGTDPGDSASLLEFQMAWPEAGDVPPDGYDPEAKLVHVRWPTVPGRSYQVETAPRLAPDPATGEAPVFAPLGEALTAAEGEYSMDVWVDITAGDVKGVFRVRLAETGTR